jgi:hypothetical protein
LLGLMGSTVGRLNQRVQLGLRSSSPKTFRRPIWRKSTIRSSFSILRRDEKIRTVELHNRRWRAQNRCGGLWVVELYC